jgi:guanylate kinase
MKDAVNIFILPPSFAALEERLKGRGDDERNIRRRLRDAVSEIEHYHEYDYLVVNDNFDNTLEQLAAILVSARYNYGRQQDYFEKLLKQLLHQDGNIR